MLSIVIPARNLAGSIVALVDEALSIMGTSDFEIVVVDDASNDATAERIEGHQSSKVSLVQHAVEGGAAAAIRSGVAAAAFPLVCVLDGDARIPPWHIPDLLRLVQGEPAVGLVLGQREAGMRGGAVGRAWTALRRTMLRDATFDPACGIRLFRRDAYLALPYFDNMHHYLAALFTRDGWQVRTVAVGYRSLGPDLPRQWSRPGVLAAVADLFGVLWLQRRRNRSRPVRAGTPVHRPRSSQ